MANPNNCETCDYKRDPDGGHCYMFRNEPQTVCMQHTGRRTLLLDRTLEEVIRLSRHETPHE